MSYPSGIMKRLLKAPILFYRLGLGLVVGRLFMVMTTTGRKSGQPRVTPLQYEEIHGEYYLGAARGLKADWVRNIQANPDVSLRVGSKKLHGEAEIVTDPVRMADFIEIRLQRHPIMIGLIMKLAHGLPQHPSRDQLERMAASEALVIIHPQK